MESSTIAYNNFGIVALAGGGDNTAYVYMSQDEISYNSTGVAYAGQSIVYSFNNNRFTENTTNGGPFTPIAFQ